jgi:hypothetical protein
MLSLFCASLLSDCLFRQGIPETCVFLGKNPVGRILLSDSRGRHYLSNPQDIFFLLPQKKDSNYHPYVDFVYNQIAELAPDLNDLSCNIALRDPECAKAFRIVLSRLKRVERNLEARRADLLRFGPSKIYEHFRHSNPSLFSEITVDKAARLLVGDVNDKKLHLHPEFLMALHKELMEDSDRFIADSGSQWLTKRFYLRPLNDLNDLKRVRGWVQDEAPQISSFIEKAKTIMAVAEANPPSTDALPIAWYQGQLPTFNDDDLTILRLLRSSIKVTRLSQEFSSEGISGLIFKTLGHPYKWEGSRWAGAVDAFRKLGIFAPWENLPAHDDALDLASWETKDGNRPTTKVAKPGTYSKDSLYPDDPHESVRHDFGTLPVYVIDDMGAYELDDGISIEPGPPTSSGKPTWWVHMHVADPTARLHPRHTISQLARRRVTSLYLPERTWSMLPDSFLESQALSLGADSETHNALTFSARLTGEGTVEDTKVRTSVLRNVLPTTYEAVSEILGEKPTEKALLFDMGHAPDPSLVRRTRSISTFNERQVEDLKMLSTLAEALCRKRGQDGALFWMTLKPNVVIDTPSILPHLTLERKPVLYTGLPRISLYEPEDAVISPSQRLVSELMVLAGRVASRFAVERGIPLLHRGQERPTAGKGVVEELEQLKDEFGQIDSLEVEKRAVRFAPGRVSTTPARHSIMGIVDDYGYTQATSPLRRFSDMVGHWQIKSALLPSRHPLADPRGRPPFSVEELETIIKETEPVSKAAKLVDKRSSLSWALFLIRHKLDQLGASSSSSSSPSAWRAEEILNSLEGIVTRPPQRISIMRATRYTVKLPVLGIQGSLDVYDKQVGGPHQNEGERFEVGQSIPVRLNNISMDYFPSFSLEKRT